MLLIVRWVLNALALLGIAYLIPGIVVENFATALIVALVIGLVNAFIRPLILILTLPVNILTLGLFTLVINALLFWLVSTWIAGFTVPGFGEAFLGALVLWAASWLTNGLLKKES
ncbi:phage holin family protein [Patescibacteria group bacterium]|nr:phage holin family protein [Patescibacteria group bacterium]MBU1921934.1 phage holin family protein [Patescibacteria group bacterium]